MLRLASHPRRGKLSSALSRSPTSVSSRSHPARSRSNTMTLNWWRRCLTQTLRLARRDYRRQGSLTRLSTRRSLCVEGLEARNLLATSITVIAGAVGTGAQDAAFFANHGVLLFNAPDVGANTLSTGALAAVAATSDIVVGATGSI